MFKFLFGWLLGSSWFSSDTHKETNMTDTTHTDLPFADSPETQNFTDQDLARLNDTGTADAPADATENADAVFVQTEDAV